MPVPFKVELLDHDPAWHHAAAIEARRLLIVVGPCLVAVHHIGSTAIFGLRAKPIIDLIAAVTHLRELDDRRDALEAAGYEWWGEYGLPQRRYCTKTEASTGRRLIQLHCFDESSQSIIRHLAFRDYLREHPAIAAEYGCEKENCRKRVGHDSHAYGDCKSAWIGKVESDVLVWYRKRRL